jgi:hypothetical protein
MSLALTPHFLIRRDVTQISGQPRFKFRAQMLIVSMLFQFDEPLRSAIQDFRLHVHLDNKLPASATLEKQTDQKSVSQHLMETALISSTSSARPHPLPFHRRPHFIRKPFAPLLQKSTFRRRSCRHYPHLF